MNDKHSSKLMLTGTDNEKAITIGNWIRENHHGYDIRNVREKNVKSYTLTMPMILQGAANYFGFAPLYLDRLIYNTLPTTDQHLFQDVIAIFKLQNKANQYEDHCRFLSVKNVIQFFYESSGNLVIDNIYATYEDYPEQQMVKIMNVPKEIACWMLSQYKKQYIQKFDKYHWDTAQVNIAKMRLLGQQYDLVIGLLRYIVETDSVRDIAKRIVKSSCTKAMIINTLARHTNSDGKHFKRLYKQAIFKLERLQIQLNKNRPNQTEVV